MLKRGNVKPLATSPSHCGAFSPAANALFGRFRGGRPGAAGALGPRMESAQAAGSEETWRDEGAGGAYDHTLEVLAQWGDLRTAVDRIKSTLPPPSPDGDGSKLAA